MSPTKNVVTLGADVGGKDAYLLTSVHVAALRKLLEQECHGPYSESIKEFAFILRIDGSVQSWGKRGVENVRMQKKAGYATADIFVPQEIWKTADRLIIRDYFSSALSEAVHKILKRAADVKVQIQSDRLIQDIEKVVAKFVS